MQSKSLGVMLKVKLSTISPLPGVPLHSTVKLLAVKLTPRILGACIRGAGGEIFMTHADSISQSVLLAVRFVWQHVQVLHAWEIVAGRYEV